MHAVTVSLQSGCVLQVWSSEKKEGYTEAVLDTDVLGAAGGLTFWRPLPAVGYAVFGDCATAGTSQPAFQVRSLNSLSSDRRVSYEKECKKRPPKHFNPTRRRFLRWHKEKFPSNVGPTIGPPVSNANNWRVFQNLKGTCLSEDAQ